MRLYKTAILFFILAASLLASCGRRSQMAQLTDIESYIDARPDSALASIRNIDTSALHGRAAKAKFALLHAIALDKNYIDTADTRIIQPAVNWYERHGTAEERMKANMYLGTELFNAGQYNKAIVSYEQAVGFSNGIKNQNLKGVLFSKMAETFTKSQEFVQANDYLDKAIECFKDCNRSDQLVLVQIMKAVNLMWLMDWEKSQALFDMLLSDNSLSDKQRGSLEGYYALMLSYNPSVSDSLAFSHFTKAIAHNGTLESVDQYCAYAYLLGLLGKIKDSELLFEQIDLSDYQNRYSHDYWKYRLYLHNGDFKQAYYSLWSSRNIVDSITRVNHALSASNAQRAHMESLTIQRQLKTQNQRWLILTISLSFFLVLTFVSILHSKRKRRIIDEKDRMEIVLNHLNNKMDEMLSEKRNFAKEKSKARFAEIASIYEDIYRISSNANELPKEKLYEVFSRRIKILDNNQESQEEFEKALNEESDNIMASFHIDYPDLSQEEYRLASYVFAGFDNTTVMLVMGIPNLEYTRVKKNRLKSKIQRHPCQSNDNYLRFF